jgi:Family of unknown function (DUF6264)
MALRIDHRRYRLRMTFDSVVGTTRPPPRRRWDLVLTIVLLVLLVPVTCVGVIAGAFLVLGSDSCGPTVVCNESTLSLGVLVSVCTPVLVFLVGGIVTIVRLYQRRIAFWVPIVATVVMGLLWVLGAVITAVSVPH